MKRAVLFACAALLVVLASGKIVKAFNPQPDPPGAFGMIGITSGETMQLNVVNVEINGVPPDPCRVQLRFLDAAGNALKQQVVSLKPRQAASLQISGPVTTSAQRAEIHPVVLLTENEPAGCSAIGTVEVFDSTTLRTSLVVNPIYIALPAVQK